MSDAIFPQWSSEHLHLRPEIADDGEFLVELYASTRSAELDRTGWDAARRAEFLRMQFTAQHGYYATNFPKAEFAIVELDGRPVGRFYVDRSEHEFRVIDIALLPDFRAHDIGTRLLRDLIAEASAVGRAITLHVERFNPARDWYERLGFASVDTHGIYVLMRREPHHHEKIA